MQFAAGQRAHIAATKGQDGSIDAWLETDLAFPSPFHSLPVPIIVECKDHDDTLHKYIENVYGAWKKVEKKLTEQSANGWTGL